MCRLFRSHLEKQVRQAVLFRVTRLGSPPVNQVGDGSVRAVFRVTKCCLIDHVQPKFARWPEVLRWSACLSDGFLPCRLSRPRHGLMVAALRQACENMRGHALPLRTMPTFWWVLWSNRVAVTTLRMFFGLAFELTFVNFFEMKEVFIRQIFCERGYPVLVAYVIMREGVWHLCRVNSKLSNWMCRPVCGRHADDNKLH